MDGRGLERAIKLPKNMFEHFFDANSPCAGLVSATDPCPCTGLPPLVLFRRGYVFAKDMRTETVQSTGATYVVDWRLVSF
jgi:hypothetical protein